jgi:ribonuclease R
MKPRKNEYSRPSKAGRSTESRPKQAGDFLDELKNDLAAFLQINNHESFSQDEIFAHFDVADRRMSLIMRGLLAELTEEGQLTRQANGTYRANETINTTEGVVDHLNQKFAFVIPTTANGIRGDRENDIWVSTDDLAGAVDGDRVRVTKFSDSRNRGRKNEGKVIEIVSRGRPEVVGRVEIWPTYGFVVPDSRKFYEDIHIAKDKLGAATDGDKVIVKLTKYPDGRAKSGLEGEVISVLGKAGQNNTEMHAILAEFGLPLDFPAEVERESETISPEILPADLAKRRDMRDVTTFTIDPIDAKDFDDALSVKYLDSGNYEIGVHIADVTHYVRPGTALEAEAQRRATSVYLVDRVVPMLPEKLSNNLCSLRPNEDKLTFSAVFELDANGAIMHEWFGRTAIHSDRRFSYEEAQEILNTGVGDYHAELLLLNQLAYKLRDVRFKNGAINFETVEVKFRLDENGVPLGVYPKIRQDTNKLIEEFMLLANKRVAEFVHSLSKLGAENTMVYRVHENPDEERLHNLSAFAKRLGYKLNVEDPKHISGAMNRFMDSIEGKPEQNLLQQLAVRTMAKARYTTDDLGHFGLAFRRYSHFTSPIRRYPDMMAHRLLQHYLDKGKPADREQYEALCRTSSEQERRATEAERASIKYKQVEFMSRIDKDQAFSGVISGVTEFGIFVEITENSCEGLIRMTDLPGDYYEYDRENYRVIGQRSKRMFTFGDAVTVKLKETNLSRRSMDFFLVNAEGQRVASDFGDRRPRESGFGGERVNRSAVAPKGSSRAGAGSASAEKKPAGRKPAATLESKRAKGPAPKGQNRRGGRGK